MVRQTVPDGYYPVSELKFSQVIVTVMLNQFIFITSSENKFVNFCSNRVYKRYYESCDDLTCIIVNSYESENLPDLN